jgi:hypothetical protein
MSFLLLGVDSLIACIAIGPIIGRRSRLPLAAAVGFLVGTALHWQIADGVANIVQTAVLVGLGLYWVAIAVGTRRAAGGRGKWILPIALSLDNLTYGLVGDHSTASVFGQAGQQAASSALLAMIGLLVAGILPRVVPALEHRVAATRIAGGALVVAAGLELLVG